MHPRFVRRTTLVEPYGIKAVRQVAVSRSRVLPALPLLILPSMRYSTAFMVLLLLLPLSRSRAVSHPRLAVEVRSRVLSAGAGHS